MKVRAGFVSNSSSSSFICCAEDAADMHLFNDSQVLSLHEYLEKFGEQDVMSWWPCEREMRFASDKKYCEMFKSSIYMTLPKSAREAYLVNPREWEVLMPYVEAALSKQWKDVKLEYYEAEDSMMVDNDIDEESYLQKMFDSRQMKFKRVFNNH